MIPEPLWNLLGFLGFMHSREESEQEDDAAQEPRLELDDEDSAEEE